MAAGFAVLDVDFRGSTGYGRTFRMANHDEWGHADVQDVIDAARWAADQPWADGRLAIYGGSYGGYVVLCALVEEPSMWRAGVDLYGDSEIAESYRHGDRLGRLDLHKMMGSPDDAARLEVYRRGSPVYRAERIEAPLLLIHGRKDKRVVPLMTERMVEALEIEGKRHEVHWYDEEGHGWEKRENRRDAFERILGVPQDERPRRPGRLGLRARCGGRRLAGDGPRRAFAGPATDAPRARSVVAEATMTSRDRHPPSRHAPGQVSSPPRDGPRRRRRRRIASAIVAAMPIPMSTSPMLNTFANGSQAGSAKMSVSGARAGSGTMTLFV